MKMVRYNLKNIFGDAVEETGNVIFIKRLSGAGMVFKAEDWKVENIKGVVYSKLDGEDYYKFLNFINDVEKRNFNEVREKLKNYILENFEITPVEVRFSWNGVRYVIENRNRLWKYNANAIMHDIEMKRAEGKRFFIFLVEAKDGRMYRKFQYSLVLVTEGEEVMWWEE